MKTRLLILTAIMPIILIATIFWVFDKTTYSTNNEGIGITHVSKDDLQNIINQTNSTTVDVVKITEDDLRNVPIIKNLIQGIDTTQEISTSVPLSRSELDKYKMWIEEKGIGNTSSLFEYNNQYYQIGIWIA